jgi:hypothetical protein
VLTTAHLNHRPEDCGDANLRAWCPSCHSRYDGAHHAETRAFTRQRLQAEAAGMLF